MRTDKMSFIRVTIYLLTLSCLLAVPVFAADRNDFHGRTLGPQDWSYCGYHVQVSGDFLTLTPVANPLAQGRLHLTWGCPQHPSVLFKCQDDLCTRMRSPVEVWKAFEEQPGPIPSKETKEFILLLDDGNLVYIPYKGGILKYFRSDRIADFRSDTTIAASIPGIELVKNFAPDLQKRVGRMAESLRTESRRFAALADPGL